jgi:hypothetical protein
MAKTAVNPEPEIIETPVINTASVEPVNPGLKVITNLQACPQNIPLTNGTSYDLGPKFSNNRTSPPILGKLLNKDFIKRLEHEGKIRVEGC